MGLGSGREEEDGAENITEQNRKERERVREGGREREIPTAVGSVGERGKVSSSYAMRIIYKRERVKELCGRGVKVLPKG